MQVYETPEQEPGESDAAYRKRLEADKDYVDAQATLAAVMRLPEPEICSECGRPGERFRTNWYGSILLEPGPGLGAEEVAAGYRWFIDENEMARLIPAEEEARSGQKFRRSHACRRLPDGKVDG